MRRNFRLRHALPALLISAAALAGAGCAAVGDDGGFASDGRLRVATSTNFITDTVRQIGGDDVEVNGLMGPGVDPHLYKASANDVATLRSADVILYGGLHLEGRMGDVFEQMAERRRTAAVTRAIPRERLLEADGEHDPHVWFDPSLWRRAADVIAAELIRADPGDAADYRARHADFVERLRRTDARIRRRFAAIPRRRRVLVTSHDAFGYFGRHYGFDVVAIQGISTATEATTASVGRVAEVVARRGVKAVFVESSVPRQTLDAVLAAAGRRGQRATIGGELFADAAGEPGTREGTYIGMIEHNAKLIERGLR